MSDKIGIITIHSVFNYGAMLQAYALSEYLNSMGYSSEVIDYRPYKINSEYDVYIRDIFLRPKKILFHFKMKLMKKNKFIRFRDFENNYIKKSNKKYIIKKSLNDNNYSLVITGSDQIWNPYITGYDTSFLLDFIPENVSKMAYSSSFGISDIPDCWEEKIAINLRQFDYLGLREEAGRGIVSKIIPNINTSLVLDPVFLLPKSHWEDLSNNDFVPNYDYLLVYSLEVNSEMIHKANKLAEKYSLKILTVHPYQENYDFSDLSIGEAGPKEFISLIRNARYIVTNSFHGAAFSIIFEKEFICINHSKTGSRMSNLISSLDVPTLCVQDVEIYYPSEESKNKLEEKISFSQSFLLNSVKSCLNLSED